MGKYVNCTAALTDLYNFGFNGMSKALPKVGQSKNEFTLHKNAGLVFSPLIRAIHNLNILLSPLPFHKFPPQLRHVSHEVPLYIP